MYAIRTLYQVNIMIMNVDIQIYIFLNLKIILFFNYMTFTRRDFCKLIDLYFPSLNPARRKRSPWCILNSQCFATLIAGRSPAAFSLHQFYKSGVEGPVGRLPNCVVGCPLRVPVMSSVRLA